MMRGPAGGWGMFEAFGAFLGVLLLLGLLALAAWGAYRLIPNSRIDARLDPAEGILRERFARGEIPAGEYEETLEILRRHPQQGNSPLPTYVAEPRRYERYLREAINRLRLGRDAGS